jgi:hypothetical protein
MGSCVLTQLPSCFPTKVASSIHLRKMPGFEEPPPEMWEGNFLCNNTFFLYCWVVSKRIDSNFQPADSQKKTHLEQNSD